MKKNPLSIQTIWGGKVVERISASWRFKNIIIWETFIKMGRLDKRHFFNKGPRFSIKYILFL
jgi:hypothetical protein